MSRILFALLLFFTACKKEETKTEEAPREAPPPNTMTAKEVLTALPRTQNGCPEVYDYFPDGGIRIFWCHVQTVVPFSKLSELSGVPVFLSGPHSKDALVLDSKTSFGRYNPAFVRWMIDRALPTVTDPAARKELEPIYDRFLLQRGRIYFSALQFQKVNPEVSGEDHYPEEWPNEFPPAVSFWQRRTIDNTAPLFEEGLRKLLGAFDAQAIDEISKKDWKVVADSAGSWDPALDGATLQQRVKLAWTSLVNKAPESACPDQFAYEPGGIRVQYCRGAGIIGYQMLQAELGFPIFIKGPHTKTELSLNSEQFGHYNPKFVEWLIDNAVPAATEPALRTASQGSYDRHLKSPARLWLFTREMLKRDPSLKSKMKAEYAAFMKSPEPGAHPHWNWESLIPAPAYEEQAIGGTAFAFWIRRSLDGTDDLFDRGLRKIMKTYDAEMLRSVESAKTIEQVKALFGPPVSPDEDEIGD